MSDVAGAAPAAAESAPAPVVDEQIVDVPNPVETVDEPAPAPKEPAKPPSIRDALDKAERTVQAKQEAKPEAKPEPKAAPKEAAKAEPVKDPATGKFVAKDRPADPAAPANAAATKTAPETPAPTKSQYEAPKRFSEDAKKVWDTAPDPVKAEVARMEREMSAGIEKHREKAEKYDAIREFDEMATKSGTTVKDALSRYVGMEQKLRGNLLDGLEEIVSNASQGKLGLRDVAAHIMGQTPEQNQSQDAATIRELKQTVARLEQQVGGVTQSITQQREHATLQEVTKFAEAHPRFEDLADDIGFFMQSGRAKDLSEAYTLAERLNPAPARATVEEPKAADASAKVTDLAEQIRKGSKSPTGAPSAGSDPVAIKRQSKSIRQSLDRAFAARA